MRIRILGHAAHPMLVVFPLGLFITAVVFDAIGLGSGNSVFGEVGFWDIAAGLIGAVLAALTGLTDWTGVPAGTRAKRVGLTHGLLNAGAVVLFLIAWAVRLDNADHGPSAPVFIVEIIALAIAGVAAWYGGELVDRLGIGVDPNAHPDAPSSLRPAGRQPGSAGDPAHTPAS